MPIRDPFAQVLERVQREASGEAEGASPRPVGASGFQVPFSASDGAFAPATPEILAGLYTDELAPDAAAAPVLATDAEGIARELGLASAATAEDLNRLRRRFALASHPDRAAPGQRLVATRRMMIANRLIDEALARLG